MAKGRRLFTNFSKGELSPLIEGRPDLAAYFEGGSKIENFLVLRQGGLDRRYGLRFISEVKDSSKDTILLPFEASIDDAFILEFGNLYSRFYRDKARLPIEIGTQYLENQLRLIHFTQSVDVLFLFHGDVQQHRLSRLSDTNWSLNPINYASPPSFEKDTDISGGSATLTPAAITGNNINFTASSGVFLAGDIGRVIVAGASRALITSVTSATVVVANILDDFASTGVIPAGSWLLRTSPQATLDPDKKEPVGATVTLVANINAFRSVDVGKFITIYGGLVEITHFTSALQVEGIIKSEMAGTSDANPAAAPAGAWTLEVESWSPTNGYPGTGEFFQGRLGQARTRAQPTNFWLSAPDDFEDYAVGGTAGRAIDYTIAARKLNRIEWLADRDDLFVGTSGAEIRVTSGKSDEPFGGDIIPVAKRFNANGSAPIQPVIIGNRPVYVDRSRKKIFSIAFEIEQDSFDTVEITGAAEHITGNGIKLGPPAFTTRPDPRIYYVREDGQLIALTFFVREKVIAFSRIVTDGFFESVAVKPHAQDTHGGHDEVWVIVRRIINGVTKRYVEMFEDHHEPTPIRPWHSLQTDSAIFYQGPATNIITGLGHLEGKLVDVIADGGFKGQKIVINSQIILDEKYTEVEVGLHYDSEGITMRPTIEGQMIEGMPRSWDKLFARLRNTRGGSINNELIQYSADELTNGMYTGDKDIMGVGWGTDGRVTIKQNLPYPMTVLALFGTLDLGESD